MMVKKIITRTMDKIVPNNITDPFWNGFFGVFRYSIIIFPIAYILGYAISYY